MLAIDNPFGSGRALVRLLEPSDADRGALAAQLLSGTYDKPFVVKDGTPQALHFCWTYTRAACASRARDAPDVLRQLKRSRSQWIPRL